MLLFRCQIFHGGPERLLKSLLGIILLVHFTAFCPHGGQLFRVFNGVLQQDSQLLRIVVMVDEAVPPLGDEPGGAGVLRYDGRLAEDQATVTKVGMGSSREAQTRPVHCSIRLLISSRVSRLQ